VKRFKLCIRPDIISGRQRQARRLPDFLLEGPGAIDRSLFFALKIRSLVHN